MPKIVIIGEVLTKLLRKTVQYVFASYGICATRSRHYEVDRLALNGRYPSVPVFQLLYTKTHPRILSKVKNLVLLSDGIQDAQLSQRDRAAGCVIVWAKSGRLELGDNILRTL